MFFKIIFYLLTFFLSISLAANDSKLNNKILTNSNLVHLGNVNEKEYFYSEIPGVWGTGNDFCIASGLKIAIVNSTSERDFLKDSNLPVPFSYWVGARDANHVVRFDWEDEEQLDSDLMNYWEDSFTLPWTCVYYVATDNSINGQIRATRCATNTLRVLCEA